MTSNNGAAEVQITTEHLQELFRRLPAASEMMRMILLESENADLKARVEALEAPSGVHQIGSEAVTSADEASITYAQ
jgi:hypothetical protein